MKVDSELSDFSLSVPNFEEVADETGGDDFSICLSSVMMNATHSTKEAAESPNDSFAQKNASWMASLMA